MFDGNLTDASLPHRRNADAPMLVQLFEKPSDDNEEQSANAFSSTVFDCIDALFKAELTRCPGAFIYSFEHRLGTAGVKIAVIFG